MDVHARAPRARARAKLLAADDIILNKNGKNNQFSLPPLTAMSAMTALTVFLLLKSRFIATTQSIMMIFCIRLLFTRFRIVIQGTVLQTAIPAPGATTSISNVKFVFVIQATGKDVGTCVILQAPTFTPGALPSIIHSFLWLRFL